MSFCFSILLSSASKNAEIKGRQNNVIDRTIKIKRLQYFYILMYVHVVSDNRLEASQDQQHSISLAQPCHTLMFKLSFYYVCLIHNFIMM